VRFALRWLGVRRREVARFDSLVQSRAGRRPDLNRAAVGVTGIVIVDHGSRRAEANRRHESFVDEWRGRGRYAIVEPAHMELAQPTIGQAFDACVAGGATTVVIVPYFLWPGSHWDRDIPALAAEAATRHAGVDYLVAAPLGPHPLLATIVEQRIEHCLAHVAGEAPECEVCAGTGRCRFR
jgi:sirohydrochlorin ferrochelatase